MLLTNKVIDYILEVEEEHAYFWFLVNTFKSIFPSAPDINDASKREH